MNEGVREKENSDRLEWIQAHVQCEGLSEVLHLLDLKDFAHHELIEGGKTDHGRSVKKILLHQ